MTDTIEIVPISGLETDICMPEKLYQKYLDKKQIASSVAPSTPAPPNLPVTESASLPQHQIEAMTSENGLVLGRTGLVENLKKGLYTNVFNAQESKIFTNAVLYINGLRNKK